MQAPTVVSVSVGVTRRAGHLGSRMAYPGSCSPRGGRSPAPVTIAERPRGLLAGGVMPRLPRPCRSAATRAPISTNGGSTNGTAERWRAGEMERCCRARPPGPNRHPSVDGCPAEWDRRRTHRQRRDLGARDVSGRDHLSTPDHRPDRHRGRGTHEGGLHPRRWGPRTGPRPPPWAEAGSAQVAGVGSGRTDPPEPPVSLPGRSPRAPGLACALRADWPGLRRCHAPPEPRCSAATTRSRPSGSMRSGVRGGGSPK